MSKVYEIVEIAKLKNNIESDNAFAIRFGFRRQNINDWKVERSEPKGINLLKLLKAADISIDEAILIMEESERPVKEAGFSNVIFLSALGIGTIGAMTLAKMSALPYEALGITGVSGLLCILCKITQS